MTTSIREQLIAAVCTAMGAQYGAYVDDQTAMPVTVVVDGTDSASNTYDLTTVSMPISVGRAEAVTAHAAPETQRTQANAALAKLITDMHAGGDFGGLCRSCEYTGGELEYHGDTHIVALANFTLTYQHARGNPSTQFPT